MSAKSSTKGRRPGSIYLEPDSLAVVIPAVLGALAVGGVSFLMSWDALRVVARWAGIAEARTWGLPLAMDASILVFSALWLIARRRGLSTWFHITAVTAFTLGSVGGNVSHALADGSGKGWQIAVGAVAAAAFPMTVFATTHAVAGLLVDPDADVSPVRRRRPAPTPAPVPTLTPTAPTSPLTPTPAPSRPVSARPVVVRTLPDRAVLEGQVLDLASSGASQRVIAEHVGVSKSSVARILASRQQQGVLVNA
ncbi:MAG: DUF2637 domain-containing protein [Cellulomonas sp.]